MTDLAATTNIAYRRGAITYRKDNQCNQAGRQESSKARRKKGACQICRGGYVREEKLLKGGRTLRNGEIKQKGKVGS